LENSSVVLIAAVLLAIGLVVPVVERSMSYINQANVAVTGYPNPTAVDGENFIPEDQDTPVIQATAGDAGEALNLAQLAIASAKNVIEEGEKAGVNVSEAISLVEQAQNTFDAGKAYLEQGNYQLAYNKGRRARSLAVQAEDAVDQQLADMAEQARLAIESAEKTIRKAEDLSGSLNSTGFTSSSQAGVFSSWSLISFQNDQPPSPEDLLTQAEELLAQAKVAYYVRDYREALRLAEEAKSLAESALQQLLNPPVPVTMDEAQTEIARAKTAKLAACEAAGDAATLHVNVDELLDQLNRASPILDEAIMSFQEGEYNQARANAIQSRRIFESAEKQADALAEKARTTIENVQKADAFPVGSKGPLEFSEDGSGNLVVEAENHSVTIERSHPALRYSVHGDGGAASFESSLFAFIEFGDNDGDDEIDENEVVKVVQLDSLGWTHGEQKTTRGEKTTLEVWYRFQSPEYDFWIVMSTFEAPTLQHLSVDDDIVMWFVDGNAREVKLDLIVEKWPWFSPEDKLALRLLVSPEEGGVIQTREVGDNEIWVGISYNDETVRIKSMMKALVFDGSNRTVVEVKMDSKELPGGEVQVDFVYPNFGAKRLVHDPSLGIGGPFAYVPVLSVPWMMLGTGILGLVVLASGKRLEKRKIRQA